MAKEKVTKSVKSTKSAPVDDSAVSDEEVEKKTVTKKTTTKKSTKSDKLDDVDTKKVTKKTEKSDKSDKVEKTLEKTEDEPVHNAKWDDDEEDVFDEPKKEVDELAEAKPAKYKPKSNSVSDFDYEQYRNKTTQLKDVSIVDLLRTAIVIAHDNGQSHLTKTLINVLKAVNHEGEFPVMPSVNFKRFNGPNAFNNNNVNGNGGTFNDRQKPQYNKDASQSQQNNVTQEDDDFEPTMNSFRAGRGNGNMNANGNSNGKFNDYQRDKPKYTNRVSVGRGNGKFNNVRENEY